MDLLLFVLGFIILIKGADVLIKGATSIALLLGMSTWVIGVVIVGIGTSIPEFSINIASVFAGVDIGLGTIIGGNTFNILFILGIAALITPLAMRKGWVKKDFLINILAVTGTMLALFLPILGDKNFAGITREEGFIILILFIAWMWMMVIRRKVNHTDKEKQNYPLFTLTTSFLLILAGIIGVFIGGRWVVDGAEALANYFGIADAFIGLVIVAIGTSIPELTVTLTAAYRNRPGLAVGNIIGSNIFDFLGVLGPLALLKPIPFPQELHWDILVTLFASILLALVMIVDGKNVLRRKEGLIFVLIYLAYIGFLFHRI